MRLVASELALYGTIWVALALFAAGQAGIRTIARGGRACRCAWWLWAAGAFLCVAHMILAFGVRHEWSHDAAVQATAMQTESVYGLRWGAGIVANYVFAAVWTAEAVWWRVDAASFFRRRFAMTLAARGFYLLILVNAAIIFASPSRRVAGMLLVGGLLWIWWPAEIREARTIYRK